MNIDMNEFEKEYNEFIKYLKKRKENNFNDDGIVIPNINNKISTTKHVEKPVQKSKELDVKLKRIQQLREDISNGRVIKVPTGNGNFVWKRIK